MLKLIRKREFSNGIVYAMETEDGYPIEAISTHLPYYTKNCINEHTNKLRSNDLGSYHDRYIVGVSCMSGCPVKCKFCATGNLKKLRKLTAEEIVEQVWFIINENEKNGYDPVGAKEFKINYTRMGEPFLNIDAIKIAIKLIDKDFPFTHRYISTVGIKGSDFSWIKDNITLQVSLHSFVENNRDWLIPITNKLTIEELGQIRTQSNLKTTINLTLVDTEDFDINSLK